MISLSPEDDLSSVTLVDATWVLPDRTQPLDDFLLGTRHSVDTDAIKTLDPEERPNGSVAIFGQAGLRDDIPLYVYDRAGLFSAPWIWWLLRSHGIKAHLLEGWGETVSKFSHPSPTQFISKANPAAMNATKDDVLNALCSSTQIIDARSLSRFKGESEEPRPGCRAGHIPGSLNIPFETLKNGRFFKSSNDLKAIFDQTGIDLSKPIITSCGSGVTASGLAFALTRCGADSVKVYQGSWAEWGTDPTLPIETGP